MGQLVGELRKSHRLFSVLVIGYDKYPPRFIYNITIRIAMTVTRLAFKLDSDSKNNIDLAQSMSLVQRTLVRQKQTFTVLGGQIVDNADATVKISTAPNTWYVRAAVNRCFNMWKKMRSTTLANAALDGTKQSTGKYADFKISLNANSPVSQNKLPIYTGQTASSEIASGGAWDTSSAIDEMGNERHFRILGDNLSSTQYYAAVMGWLTTRPIPNANNEPDMQDLDGNNVQDSQEDFLNLLFDTADGQPERLNLLYNDNDDAPFAVNNVYGNYQDAYNLQPQSLTYISSNNPHHMIAGFKALCGLVQVDVQGGTNPVLFLDVLNTPEAF